MLVTPSGMVIDSNELQFLKAEPPMLTRLSGNATSVRSLQPEKLMEVNLSLYLKSTHSISLSEQSGLQIFIVSEIRLSH